METQCIDIERIAEIADLPADHPARQHAGDCPRCRNLLRSYQQFLRAEPVAGSGIDAARRQLDAFILSKEKPSAPLRPSRMSLSSVLHGLMRPAPLVAAAAAVVMVAVVMWEQSRGPEDILLRSGGQQSTATPPAEVRPDGSIQLTWAPVAGADHYQVRIYGPDLTEIYRHTDIAETSAVIDRASLPSDLPPTLDLMWRVYALQSGDVIEVSEPRSIRIR